VILVPFSVVLRGLTPIPGGDIVIYAVLLAVLALVLPQGIAGWFMARRKQLRVDPRSPDVRP
jgi:branched-chain amino acid transport system permease protein